MSTSVRLPDALQDEGKAYAKALGLSLNGLIAVALREYLDGRRVAPVAPVAPAVVETVLEDGAHLARTSVEKAVDRVRLERRPGEHPRAVLPARQVVPQVVAPANRRAPCPCGSGKRYSQCHGLA